MTLIEAVRNLDKSFREALGIKQEQRQGESEPIAKCRYHLSCSFCKHDWWSEEPFPKKCPKCRTEFMK